MENRHKKDISPLASPLAFGHELLRGCLRAGDWAVDATVGNGHDTAFLAGLVGPEGRVLGFDIQAAALETTRERLRMAGLLSRVDLFLEGHEHAGARVGQGTIGGMIFNLGYLPGGDKSVVTRGETTLRSLAGLLPRLRPGGRGVLMLYYGHPGGPEEMAAVQGFVEGLDQKVYTVLRYEMLNWKNTPPFLIAIERR